LGAAIMASFNVIGCCYYDQSIIRAFMSGHKDVPLNGIFIYLKNTLLKKKNNNQKYTTLLRRLI